MRAIRQHSFGEPWDVLQVDDIATPEPGVGQVRVRTLMSPIHNHDLWTVRGTYGFSPSFPLWPGPRRLASSTHWAKALST